MNTCRIVQVVLLILTLVCYESFAHDNKVRQRSHEDNQDIRRNSIIGNIFTHYYYGSPSPSPSSSSIDQRSHFWWWSDPSNVVKRDYFSSPDSPTTAPTSPSRFSGQNVPASPSPSENPSHLDSPSSFPSDMPSTVPPSSCEDVVDYESRILVGLIGRPDYVTGQEIHALQRAFLDTYNTVDCGDRNMTTVTIVTSLIEDNNDDNSRVLQASTKNRIFTYIFRAIGRCRGCRRNPRLFGEGVRHLLGDSEEVYKDKSGHRSMQDECPCPPPTENEFILAYNATIADLVSVGSLVNVVGANENFSELEQVDCTDDVTDFEPTNVTLVFEGGDTQTSESEWAALEEACVDAYNEANALNGNTCDLLFLVAVEAEFSAVNKSENRHRGLQSRQLLYNLLLRGSCRGCQCNPRLFGESQGRRAFAVSATLPPFMYHSARHLQAIDGCYCPVGEPEFRLATEEEFQTVYNEIIEYLRDEGILTSINAVVEVTESEGPNDCCDLSSGFDSAGNRYGRFFGIVVQSNSGTYNVTIDYSPAGIVTEYIQLSCGNTVPIEPSLVADGRLEWIERIEYGSNCINGGSISLTQNNQNGWDYLYNQNSVQVRGPLSFECTAECPQPTFPAPFSSGEAFAGTNDCENNACGFEFFDASSAVICCPSNETERIPNRQRDGRTYCTGQAVGEACGSNTQCSSGACEENACFEAERCRLQVHLRRHQ